MIKKTFTQTQIIALGFFLMIAAGTLLLLCPFSSRNGSVPVLDALFTATSASCVTGLVTVDTYTQWSRFGPVSYTHLDVYKRQVYIVDANEEITPHKKAVTTQEIEEERRLFYVAMTRAKNELHICSVKERCV